jgi:stage VI sporulation protein D
MTENNSSLTFSVSESVWFQKGQEVNEILSMSLEPEIVIEERGDYISINGALQLVGEYVPKEDTGEDDDTSLREETNVRFVEDVSISEDGISELTHRFPVDITVPANRVRHLDDIYVIIDSFDYDIPENGSLKLSADIEIRGIEEAASQDEGEEQHQQDTDNVIPFSPEASEEDIYVETRKAPDTDQADYEYKDMVTQNRPPQVEMKSRYDQPSNEYEGADEQDHNSGKRDENALYLTKMLAGRDDDEQRYSRLKMCIAQAGDTLQEIADRYKVSVTQIMRVNHLDSEDIQEGQVINIPHSQKV